MASVLRAVHVPSRANVVATVPVGLDAAGRRAMERAALDAGASRVLLMEAPLAGAIGCGLPVDSERGCLVLDVGARVCEAALIADGRVAMWQVARNAHWPQDDTVEVAADTALRLIEAVWAAGRIDALDAGLTMLGGWARSRDVVRRVAARCPVDVVTPSRPDERVVCGAASVFEEMATFHRLARRT